MLIVADRGVLIDMDKLLSLSFVLFTIFIATACTGANTTDEINTLLEQTVEIEKVFADAQAEINKLEQKDEKLYDEIIHLKDEDKGKLIELSEEAIALLKKREEIKMDEKKSISQSKEVFDQLSPLIEHMEDNSKKELLVKMYDTMQSRYNTYNEVYDSYETSIQLTKQLYEYFTDKKSSQEKIYSMLNQVNESYHEVERASEAFNTYTSIYNELKEQYYEGAKDK